MGNLPSIIIVVLLPSRRSLALRNLAFGIPLFGRFFFSAIVINFHSPAAAEFQNLRRCRRRQKRDPPQQCCADP